MAKDNGVSGWHSMRKDELIRALVREAKKASKPAKTSSRKSAKTTSASLDKANSKSKSSKAKPVKKSKALSKAAEPRTNPRIAQRIKAAVAQRMQLKDLARSSSLNEHQDSPDRKDRVILLVRDPFWLQAYWELRRSTIDRIRAAMAENWHGAKPVLRLSEIESVNTTSTSESVVRDIEIHGGVSNWYIDVNHPPKCFRVTIGYKAANGKFYSLARSNKVTTPQPGSSDSIDENWSDIAKDCEKIYALSGGYSDESLNSDLRSVFEERMQRPMSNAGSNHFGVGADGKLRNGKTFGFEVDAEMVIYGATEPNASVTLAGEPLKLREDGTFTVRVSMPDKRQVLPVVASSSDGVEQRTTVLAVERNTKVMEPFIKEFENDE
jgi:hypothetical protein